jgi:FlaA1/EpsC-like NDP-sugar epimerase
MDLTGKRILVTGGTGSLGGVLVRKLMSGAFGVPAQVVVFSRDEDKQHTMRLLYQEAHGAAGLPANGHGGGDRPALRFVLGDVRDYASIGTALRDVQVVIHAAALKQVPSCEYAPGQAVQTNVQGACNLVRAIAEQGPQVELLVGISTDKACEPINVMGMTKALQERVFIEGNLACPNTRFVLVRYGNVIASRGSVIPLYQRQIMAGGPVTVTTPEMTRFLITLDEAVETIMAAVRTALPGEIYVPKLPAARMVDVARALMDGRDLPLVFMGIRPGEKIHETLVSEVECLRTIERDGHYVIRPLLPELGHHQVALPALQSPFSSRHVTCDGAQLRRLLQDYLPRQEPMGAEVSLAHVR